MQSEPGTPIEHRDLNFPSADCLTVPDAQMREALSEGATALPSEGSSSATLSPNMDAEYLTKLEQEITTSLNKLGYKEEATVEGIIDCDTDSTDSSDDDAERTTVTSATKQITPIQRKRTTSQPTVKRVEFEDTHAVRPSNLELHDEPIRPPRAKDRKEKRNERLLSVPNLKMNAASVPKDLRSKSGSGSGGSGGFAANFVRRFSKYQLCALKQLLVCVVLRLTLCVG